MNAGRFFLDTNVFVYSFDRTNSAKQIQAEELVRSAIRSGRGCISFQVVNEFLNVAPRKFQAVIRQSNLTAYIETVFRSLNVIDFSFDVITEALRLRSSYQLSWYDSLIVAAAIEGRCGTLFTEDLQHGMKIGDLQIVNPFAA